MRHGCLLRLRRDRRRPHRPARLYDQGGGRYGRDRRRNIAAGAARRRTGHATIHRAIMRCVDRRRRPRRIVRRHRRRGGRSLGRRAGRTQCYRRPVRKTPRQLPHRHHTRRAVPPRRRPPHARPRRRRAHRDRGRRLGRLRTRRDRRPRPRNRDHIPPTPPDHRTRRARTPGAAARLDIAGRDDDRLIADARPCPARLPRRARADCRQRSAQPATCLRTPGVRCKTACGGRSPRHALVPPPGVRPGRWHAPRPT